MVSSLQRLGDGITSQMVVHFEFNFFSPSEMYINRERKTVYITCGDCTPSDGFNQLMKVWKKCFFFTALPNDPTLDRGATRCRSINFNVDSITSEVDHFEPLNDTGFFFSTTKLWTLMTRSGADHSWISNERLTGVNNNNNNSMFEEERWRKTLKKQKRFVFLDRKNDVMIGF